MTHPSFPLPVPFILCRGGTSGDRVQTVLTVKVRIPPSTTGSSSCLVTLNGESTVFVAREDVVDLVEAVNALVLG